MSLFEDTNPRELKELLGQIHSREAALPDFQRDFVWDPKATQELIVSIANNYPAGSLLRIRNTHDMFANREFQGAPSLDGRKITYLVLDGQQRLTSLYQAFYGVGEHRYYLDLQKLLDTGDFEESIFHYRIHTKQAARLEYEDVQSEELILPLGELKGGAGNYSRWSLRVARRMTDYQARVELEDSLASIEEKWIRAIDDYRFPVVTLSDETGAEAVCTIFETLNRTGVKLSVFELLTARFWPKNVNLRRLWEAALADYPILEDFDIDPYYLLQVVALNARERPACTRSYVLDLESEQIEEWWDRAVFGMADGLSMLQDDCGVIIPKWLPYNTMTITLAAVLARATLKASPEIAVHRNKIKRWFWCSVFGQSYESAANSQIVKDLQEVVAWLEGGPEPETVAKFQFDPRMLRETTYRQRALYRGSMALLLSQGPRDFHTGARITGDLMTEQHIDDHHIFPAAYLRNHVSDVPARLRDSILNRTLIDRKTNQVISARAPSDYMQEIQDAHEESDPDGFRRLLQSHLLPTGLDSPFWRNDFHGFIDWRQQAIWNLIKDATGVTEATDLVEEEEIA